MLNFLRKKIHISGEVEVCFKNLLLFIYFHRMQTFPDTTIVSRHDQKKNIRFCGGVLFWFFLNILDKGL